jgi:hypothetical protein
MNRILSYIASADESLQPILMDLRALILAQHPMIEERFRYSIPFYDYHGWMCYINLVNNKKHVALCFIDGYKLDDEEGILEVKGRKIVRSLTFASALDAAQKDKVREFIQQAMMIKEANQKIKK